MINLHSTMFKATFGVVFYLFISVTSGQIVCNLNQTVIDDIQSYQTVVNQIIDYFLTGAFKGQTYERLAYMTDTYGPRPTGSQALEDTIDWVAEEATLAGLQSHTEYVTVPFWVRNNESLWMTSPREELLKYLSFGNSVATPPEGIEAEVLVVTSFDDLDQNAALVPGKIVVYDVPFTTYGETNDYRYDGADAASQYGGVAALVRSVTDFSIDSPHTGVMNYNGSVPKIPTGAVTIEDATMFHRMQDRGQQVRVKLTMNAETLNDTTSRNVIAELAGSTTPSEVVVLSGHIDSWDVGEGVMDDGGGCVISMIATMALNNLGLIPRRSLRTIMFTSEEIGIYGGNQYYDAHIDELESFQLMMESDGGLWNPYGIGFNGTDDATCMMQEVLSLMSNLNATLLRIGSEVPDLGSFVEAGVPTASPLIEDDRYFWFHHTDGDAMPVVDSDELDECAALWAAVGYVTADMTYRLPAVITP